MNKQDLTSYLENVLNKSIMDLVRVDNEGTPYYDFSLLTPELKSIIQECSIQVGMKNGEPVPTVRLKLVDKARALELLSKIEGYAVDRLEIMSDEGKALLDQLRKERENL